MHEREKTQLIKEQESLRNQLSLATADADDARSKHASLQEVVKNLTDERDDLRSQLDRMLHEFNQFKKMSELTHQKEPDSQQCMPLSDQSRPGLSPTAPDRSHSTIIPGHTINEHVPNGKYQLIDFEDIPTATYLIFSDGRYVCAPEEVKANIVAERNNTSDRSEWTISRVRIGVYKIQSKCWSTRQAWTEKPARSANGIMATLDDTEWSIRNIDQTTDY
jgi:hypothetical protein